MTPPIATVSFLLQLAKGDFEVEWDTSLGITYCRNFKFLVEEDSLWADLFPSLMKA